MIFPVTALLRFQKEKLLEFVFPLAILAEKSDAVAYTVQNAGEMQIFLDHNAIIGIGNRTNIKKYRMITDISKLKKIKGYRLQVKPSAAANKTTFLDGKTHSHLNNRCDMYGPEMREAFQ